MTINILAFMASVCDSNEKVSSTNLNKLGVLTGLRTDTLASHRDCSLNALRRVKWVKEKIRSLKHMRIAPTSKGNFINPEDGLIYNLPEGSRPDPDEVGKLNRSYRRINKIKSLVDKRKFKGFPPRLFVGDTAGRKFVFINNNTIPKVIGDTVCLDVPTNFTIALMKELKILVLRAENKGPTHKIWIMGKDRVDIKYLARKHNLHSLGKTSMSAQAGLRAKIKNKVAKELENGTSD